jgi:NTE family protein
MRAVISVGLVLGAGGVVGGAYHAGALAALAETTGWDPRSSELVVGTSAGASTAAALRSGLSAPDVYARATGRELSPAGASLVGEDTGPVRHAELGNGAPPAGDGRPPWSWIPEAPWLLGPAFLRAGPTRWGVALAGLAPEGRAPTGPIGDRVRAEHPARWPDQATWIVAYRTRDARRVVFGRDDVDVPDLATAVEASSAVPSRFRPTRLNSGRYLDGAVFSPTNADLVAGLGFDLVIVSSPMSAGATALGDRHSLATWSRAWFGRLLAREVAAVRDRGTPVVVLEPGPAELAAIQVEAPDEERVVLVADAARASVAALLAGDEARTLTAALGEK